MTASDQPSIRWRGRFAPHPRMATAADGFEPPLSHHGEAAMKSAAAFAAILIAIGTLFPVFALGSDESAALTDTIGTGEAAVWFLGHCGFAVRTQSHFLIFDYVEKSLEDVYDRPDHPSLAAGYIDPDEIARYAVLVFVTHGHIDHYDPVILEWEEKIPDIRYFFGWQASDNPDHHYLTGPRAEWLSDDLEIHTVNSHHSGVPEVGYLVAVDGLVIYHNGDCRGDHESDMPYLKSKTGTVDIAFVPPVWEEKWEYHHLNVELIGRLRPNALLPMHVRRGDEDKYFAPFRETFQPKMRGGSVVLTGNVKGAAFSYKSGVMTRN
jgi:L-ascorbate metabolism protein UlaG (beta-lactamase superfamily)